MKTHSLIGASRERSKRELTKAIALRQGGAQNGANLMQLYIRTGREADSDRALAVMLGLPIRTPVDTGIMRDAKGKLANFRTGT